MGGLLTRRDSRGGEGHGHDVTSEGAADVLKHKVNCVLRLLRQARHRDARHRVRSTHGQRRLGHDAFPHTVHDPCRRRRIGAGERHHEVRPAWGRGHQIEARAGARDVTGAGVPGPHGQGCTQPGGTDRGVSREGDVRPVRAPTCHGPRAAGTYVHHRSAAACRSKTASLVGGHGDRAGGGHNGTGWEAGVSSTRLCHVARKPRRTPGVARHTTPPHPPARRTSSKRQAASAPGEHRPPTSAEHVTESSN